MLISVQGISKEYKVIKRGEGIKGAVKSLIHREYESIRAIDDISFEIEQGEIVGYLGTNGSGKTTTLKMWSGIIYPTSGKISVDGFTPFERKNEFKKIFSIVMGQKNQLWWDIPAKESFDLFAAMYSLDEDEYKQRLNELVSMLDVEGLIFKPVRTLSLGERMKMEIIGSLLHNPKILFLDEPTIGLDLISQNSIRTFFKEINKAYNTTIMLTSHYMKDISELCNRVIIINKGHKILDDNIDSLSKEASSEKVLELTLPSAVPEQGFEQFGRIHQINENNVQLIVETDRLKEITNRILNEYSVLDYKISEVDFEQVVQKYLRN